MALALKPKSRKSDTDNLFRRGLASINERAAKLTAVAPVYYPESPARERSKT